MATVLNRTTKELIISANTPDYPIAEWIINPDLSTVAGFASKYWLIVGDSVSLMNQVQRDAVDAAALAAFRDAVANELSNIEDIHRAFALVCLDEFNGHAVKLNSILSAIDAATSLADLKTRIAAIADYPQRTVDQFKTSLRSKFGT